MFTRRLLATLVISTLPVTVGAAPVEWRRYTIPEAGLSVDVPVTIFEEDAGATQGMAGRQLRTSDRRADLTIKSVPNPSNDSPGVFLQKMRPPAHIQYKRVTSNFFAVSSIRDGRTWYNRCNRSDGFMNCVLINYPASEDRQWDDVVTRISLSLSK